MSALAVSPYVALSSSGEKDFFDAFSSADDTTQIFFLCVICFFFACFVIGSLLSAEDRRKEDAEAERINRKFREDK
ncbi:MAG: hypothetical protein ACPHUL_00355 [Marinomonas gallaica]